MKYANMEEAAGQYLAGMLFDADISIWENEVNTKNILIESEFLDYKARCLFEKFKCMFILIRLIKNSRSDDIIKGTAVHIGKMTTEEFDKFILAEILIYAVKSNYMEKATAADIFAEIGNPKITIFFLNETKDIDGEESFEL